MNINDKMHTAQVAILHGLLFRPAASFVELQKASSLSSDHFTFHLKQMLDQQIINKSANGDYSLTIAGKEYANRFDTEARVIERQPKVAVLLVIENNEGKWLCQQRLKQPYYGFWGRPTGKIRYGETIMSAAARELMEETSLSASLEFKGIYHKLDYAQQTNDLLEDKIFFTIYGTNPQGELKKEFEGGLNAWLSLEEMFKLDKAFAGLAETTEKIRTSSEIDFLEKSYSYSTEEY